MTIKEIKKRAARTTSGPWKTEKHMAFWIKNNEGKTIGIIYRKEDAEFITYARNYANSRRKGDDEDGRT